MTDAFSPFDAADYLSDYDDAAAYLEAVIDEVDGNPAQITEALGVIQLSQHSPRQGRTVLR